MERIRFGIDRLDEAIDGFPLGKSLLVTGGAGCGKTVLGLQFALTCCEHGLRTAYLTGEEKATDLHHQGEVLGWDLKGYEQKGLLTFIELLGKRTEEFGISLRIGSEIKKGNFVRILHEIEKETQAIIIDSLGNYAAEVSPYVFKDEVDLLVYNLDDRGITAMIILDSATSNRFDDMAMYSVYGAIKLLKRDNPFTGQRERAMDIVKMRSTATPVELLSYEIRQGGIVMTTSVEAPGKEEGRSNPRTIEASAVLP